MGSPECERLGPRSAARRGAGAATESAFPTEETTDATQGSGHLTPEDHQEPTDGPQDRGKGEERLRPHIEESEVEQIQSHKYLDSQFEDQEIPSDARPLEKDNVP